MTDPSLKSKDAVERVYALEDLRDAKTASQEELALALDYLLDTSKYGCVIVERGKLVAKRVQGTAYQGQEVRYLKDVYTIDLDNAFNTQKVCDLAFKALQAHQPAAGDVAVERLPKEKSEKMRMRILDLLNDCCRKVHGYDSPAAVRELKRIVENPKEDEKIREKALSSILLLSDPAVTGWVLTIYPRVLSHPNFRPISSHFDREMGPFIARRPLAMLKAFDDVESNAAIRVFGALRSRIARGEMSDEDAKTVITELVERDHPRVEDLLIEVIKRSPGSQIKEFARDKLVALESPGPVKLLVDNHKRAMKSGDQFTCETIEAALKNAGSPEAQAYLKSLQDER